MQNGTRLTAVDLGSNSFRLEIACLDHGQIRRTEYLKETVRQGNGLDENRQLSLQAMQRGGDCLARIGERLAGNVNVDAAQAQRVTRIARLLFQQLAASCTADADDIERHLRKLEIDFDDPVFICQLTCLRLAVILCHARREPDLKGLTLASADAAAREFTLTCRPTWTGAYPQSAHLLREEILAWQKTPWSLRLVDG